MSYRFLGILFSSFLGDFVLVWFSSSPANMGNIRNLGSCRRGSVDSGFERADDEIIL
jgi:hypothetical protein